MRGSPDHDGTVEPDHRPPGDTGPGCVARATQPVLSGGPFAPGIIHNITGGLGRRPRTNCPLPDSLRTECLLPAPPPLPEITAAARLKGQETVIFADNVNHEIIHKNLATESRTKAFGRLQCH